MHRYPQPFALVSPDSANSMQQPRCACIASRILIVSAVVGHVCFTISEMREPSGSHAVSERCLLGQRVYSYWLPESVGAARLLSCQDCRLTRSTEQERSNRYCTAVSFAACSLIHIDTALIQRFRCNVICLRHFGMRATMYSTRQCFVHRIRWKFRK